MNNQMNIPRHRLSDKRCRECLSRLAQDAVKCPYCGSEESVIDKSSSDKVKVLAFRPNRERRRRIIIAASFVVLTVIAAVSLWGLFTTNRDLNTAQDELSVASETAEFNLEQLSATSDAQIASRDHELATAAAEASVLNNQRSEDATRVSEAITNRDQIAAESTEAAAIATKTINALENELVTLNTHTVDLEEAEVTMKSDLSEVRATATAAAMQVPIGLTESFPIWYSEIEPDLVRKPNNLPPNYSIEAIGKGEHEVLGVMYKVRVGVDDPRGWEEGWLEDRFVFFVDEEDVEKLPTVP